MPGLAGAMRAAGDRARLYAMTAYPDSAVIVRASKGVRGTLEAVKGVRISPGITTSKVLSYSLPQTSH
jgi:hypothetical protein